MGKLDQLIGTKIKKHLNDFTSRSIIDNTLWLFTDRLLRMGIGLFVGVWIARYLGPEQFGMLSFSQAFVAIFTAISALGLESIVVRELALKNHDKSIILGTSFVLKLITSLLTSGVAISIIILIKPVESELHLLVIFISIGTVFLAFDNIDFWFQSQVQSKYTVYAKNSAFIVASLIKIILILIKAPIVFFAITFSIELMLTSIAIVLIYKYRGYTISRWKFNFAFAKYLLLNSWPLIISSLSIFIFMKVDLIMLSQIKGNAEVGIYTSAARLSEVWYFIPVSIVSSLFPLMMEQCKINKQHFLSKLQDLLRFLIFIGYLMAIGISLLSSKIIYLVYGEDYVSASLILAIHIWSSIFVFIGAGHRIYFIGENLQRYVMFITVFAAVLNIVLNLYFIPMYGALGASIATLISYGISNTFLLLLFNKTRPLFFLTVSALLLIQHRKKSLN